jgi:carbamate kinase
MESVLIAIGGNALYDKREGNNLNLKAIRDICGQLATVVQAGYLPLLTFGNGPQVGNLLDMAETSARLFKDPVPLDVCVSWTQGEIGYWIARELRSHLAAAGSDLPIVAVNTMVEVDPNDPAFQKPSKPVGKFISPEEASRLYHERGWVVGPDANRGYRRLVPSPLPKRILEAEAIGKLIEQNVIVLCCGGGGIPIHAKVSDTGTDPIIGVEAVIDKDYTSCLIAKTLQIPSLIICTEVDNIYLNFGQPNQEALGRVSLTEAEGYMQEGHFAAGSMGPKVAALMDYVRHGGKRAIITSLPNLVPALSGQAGTEIYSESLNPAQPA